MKLEKGMKAPDFELKNQDGKVINSGEYRGKKLFIYFYPKANTPGCTTQSCSVQESVPDFSSLDVAVIGISSDSPEKQKKFADKYSLEFPLLCDEEKKLQKALECGERKSFTVKLLWGLSDHHF